jgi:hypothetical protein
VYQPVVVVKSGQFSTTNNCLMRRNLGVLVGQVRVIDSYSAHEPKPTPRHSNHVCGV